MVPNTFLLNNIPRYYSTETTKELDINIKYNGQNHITHVSVYGSFHQVGARFVTVSIVTSVNVPSIILDYDS